MIDNQGNKSGVSRHGVQKESHISPDIPVCQTRIHPVCQYVPNILTILRLIASPACLWTLASNDFFITFWIFVAASVTDWLDGYLARRWQVTSQIGQVLDPLADKILIMTLYTSLSYKNYIPWWLTTLVLTRDLLILILGSVIIKMYRKASLLAPHIFGKATTALHMIFICIILLTQTPVSLHGSGTENFPMILFSYGITFVTILSGVFYGWTACKFFRHS